MGRILEDWYCNGVYIFYGVIIGVYEGWYGIFARLAAVWADDGATSGTADGVANEADSRIAGRATGETNGGAASGADGEAAGKAADRAIGGATGKVTGGAAGRVRTIGVWIDVTIILTNSSAYMPKLEK